MVDRAGRAVRSAASVASVHHFRLVFNETFKCNAILFRNVDTVTRCGATVTLNNTYWQAPTTLSAESTCSLSIQLNPTLAEQRRNPICQVRWVWRNPFFPILFKLNWISFWDFFRLDFEAFSIAGPNTQTVCATDNFRVSGTANRIPIICGQNVGQHSKRLPSYPIQSFQFFLNS